MGPTGQATRVVLLLPEGARLSQPSTEWIRDVSRVCAFRGNVAVAARPWLFEGVRAAGEVAA
jgi:hypothetical protein